MLRNTLIALSLIVLLTACGSSNVKPQVIYVDRVVEVYPPDSLLVIPLEPKLPEGTLTNEDIINGYIDMRSVYRELVKQVEGLQEWNKKPLQEP